jgi:hypothetical protein
MKLMPASRAFAMIREEVASSVGPPNIMVPRQIGEIFRPLRPSWRYCMGRNPPFCSAIARSEATKQSSFLIAAKLDCFASLAMTADVMSRSSIS